MFKKSQEELKALGAHITTAEIKQQPELWESTFGIYQENLSTIKEFVEHARNLGEGVVPAWSLRVQVPRHM